MLRHHILVSYLFIPTDLLDIIAMYKHTKFSSKALIYYIKGYITLIFSTYIRIYKYKYSYYILLCK